MTIPVTGILDSLYCVGVWTLRGNWKGALGFVQSTAEFGMYHDEQRGSEHHIDMRSHNAWSLEFASMLGL